MFKHTIAAIAFLSPLVIAAQSYNKDVDVTVELQPELRAASRLDIAPSIVARSFPVSALQYNGTARLAPVTPMLSRLGLVDGEPIFPECDMRGYAVAGYFPAGDMNLSAGYRIIGNRTTRLDAWGQFNRNSYKGISPLSDNGKQRLSTNDLTLGVRLGHVTSYGTLSARTSMHVSRFNYFPGVFSPKKQGMGQYMLDASWQSAGDDNESGWTLSAGVERFDFSKASFPIGFNLDEIHNAKALGETNWQVKATGRMMMTDEFGLGLKIHYRGASLNHRYLYMPGADILHEASGLHRSVVSIVPSLHYDDGEVKWHVGPEFDLGKGTDFSAVGAITWSPSPYFAIMAEARSGSSLNTLGQLYEINRYMAPLAAASRSFINTDTKAGISFGPFKGASLTARAGYSKASDYASVAVVDGVGTFVTDDLSAWWYGIDLRYDCGSIVTVNASFEAATGNKVDRAYYQWADRATRVLDVDVAIHPVKQLSIGMGYDLRLGRKSLQLISQQPDVSQPVETQVSLASLGRVSSFSLSADYAFNEVFSIYVATRGIGQKRYLLPGSIPGRRFSAIAGFSLRF
ncbi:MAG: hypothetical protein NC082_02375 [Clostridiales bacterium]|nr:hypothetical protein [Clostridiales bacterium]